MEKKEGIDRGVAPLGRCALMWGGLAFALWALFTVVRFRAYDSEGFDVLTLTSLSPGLFLLGLGCFTLVGSRFALFAGGFAFSFLAVGFAVIVVRVCAPFFPPLPSLLIFGGIPTLDFSALAIGYWRAALRPPSRNAGAGHSHPMASTAAA
jgi:hypothetical protein